jgi:hypothetical protein
VLSPSAKHSLICASPADIPDVQEAFNLFDKNGDGTISVKELREAMNAAGHDATEEMVRGLLNSHDKDGMATFFSCTKHGGERGRGNFPLCWQWCWFGRVFFQTLLIQKIENFNLSTV